MTSTSGPLSEAEGTSIVVGWASQASDDSLHTLEGFREEPRVGYDRYTQPKEIRMARTILSILTIAFLTPAAQAVDGVFEISQACVSVGCFNGDSGGFPVEVAFPGSYILTSNLLVPDVETDGILVSQDAVKIDLNGFEIIGAHCIEQDSSTCTPVSGAGRGVATDGAPTGLVVENGTVTGMGAEGVILGSQSEVRNIRSRRNGGNGIQLSQVGTIADSIVTGNAGNGIEGGASIRVSGNVAAVNQEDGILVSSASVVSENTLYKNDGDGIVAGIGAMVQRNSVYQSGDFGLKCSGTTSYYANSFSGNGSGGVDGGVNRGGNYCDGTGVTDPECP